MKKSKYLVLYLLIITIFLLTNVFALTSEEKNSINYCKKECSSNKKVSIEYCNDNYAICKKECGRNRDCLNLCSLNKKECNGYLNYIFSDCASNCKYKILFGSENTFCEDKKHKIGEVFTEGCKICKCDTNLKIECKDTTYCNYRYLKINESYCEVNGGFYQALCNGPYFDIVCTQYSYCICSGIKNYSCPEDYTCVKKFNNLTPRKGNTVPGWKTLLGVTLGDIGICAKNPLLDSCGNGICENSFLLNDLSKTPETSFNCLEDCREFSNF